MRSDGSDPATLRSERDEALKENEILKARTRATLGISGRRHPRAQKQVERLNYRITHLMRALDDIDAAQG